MPLRLPPSALRPSGLPHDDARPEPLLQAPHEAGRPQGPPRQEPPLEVLRLHLVHTILEKRPPVVAVADESREPPVLDQRIRPPPPQVEPRAGPPVPSGVSGDPRRDGVQRKRTSPRPGGASHRARTRRSVPGRGSRAPCAPLFPLTGGLLRVYVFARGGRSAPGPAHLFSVAARADSSPRPKQAHGAPCPNGRRQLWLFRREDDRARGRARATPTSASRNPEAPSARGATRS